LKIGIIGTGRIARRFVPECEKAGVFEISAVYNPHRKSAEGFVESIWQGSGEKKIKALSDTDGFWKETDAVYIASPHETHFTYISGALNNGKHVLCEKPLVLKKDQAHELFKKAQEKKLVLQEGLKTAFCPGYKHLLETAQSGAIGGIRYIEACFTKLEDKNRRELTDADYGGSFTELGSYVMLPVFDIFGAGFKQVRFDSINNEKGIDVFTKTDIRYDKAIASLSCGLGVKSEGRLLIGGEKGYILVKAPWWKTEHFELHFENPDDVKTFDDVFEGDGLRYEIRAFYDKISGTSEPFSEKERSVSAAMADMMERFLAGRN